MDRKIVATLVGVVIGFTLLLGGTVLFLNHPFDSQLDFYVLGDSQGYQGGLEQIVEDANSQHPDFVMHCGDLTPFGQETQYQEVLDTIAPLTVPFYATPGNHDVRLDGRARFVAHFGSANYSFDVGNVHMTVFDTSEGDVSSDQMEWLESDLQGSNADFKVVFTHIPLFDPRTGENHILLNTTTSEYLKNLFSESGVDTVFTGHIHMYNVTFFQGVRYVITGGAGASLAASEGEGGFYHYIHATLTLDGLDIERIALGRPSIDREHIVLKGNDEDITLSMDDLVTQETISGFSSFENQLGNWGGLGEYEGVAISELISLIGGMTPSQTLKVISSDGFEQTFCYCNVYPNATWYSYQGDMILAFEYNGTLVPDWSDGLRLVMLPEDSAYSLADCLATSAPGQGCNIYSSAGARWVRYVSIIEVIG